MMSNISSDMNKPCWKLAKACPQSQILFCSRENNLPTILTVFLVFVILYIVTGQSKLKMLVTTMALQRVRAVEALNTNRQTQNCNSELLKILMILNLVIVVSLPLRKIKKSVFF